VQRTKIRNKKVLLVANSSLLREEVIIHGLNLSRRMNASLEVLHLLRQESGHVSRQSFNEHIAKLNPDEAVGYIQLLHQRGLTTETVDYAKNRRNILCVVLCLKGKGLPRRKGVRQRKFKEVTKLLNCPVVLYTDTPVD
jgi:hypothetical protein